VWGIPLYLLRKQIFIGREVVATRPTGITQILVVLLAIWFAYPILKELRRFFVEEFHGAGRFHDPGELFLIMLIALLICTISVLQNKD